MTKRRPYKCVYCGRTIGAPIGHRCRGTMRYRNLLFRDMTKDNTFVGKLQAYIRFIKAYPQIEKCGRCERGDKGLPTPDLGRKT